MYKKFDDKMLVFLCIKHPFHL